MVTVAIRALDLEYLDKILYRGRSRSRYIFTDTDPTQNSFRLRVHSTEWIQRLSGRGVNLVTHLYLHRDQECLDIYLQYYTRLSHVE
jgi:hypothetical protein